MRISSIFHKVSLGVLISAALAFSIAAGNGPCKPPKTCGQCHTISHEKCEECCKQRGEGPSCLQQCPAPKKK